MHLLSSYSGNVSMIMQNILLKKDVKDQLCWVPFVDQLVGFVGQEGPLMAALFDTTEESRENKPREAKGQKQAAQQP